MLDFRKAHKITSILIKEANDSSVSYPATFGLVCKALASGWEIEHETNIIEELKELFSDTRYDNDTFDDEEDFQEEMETSKEKNMEEKLLELIITILRNRYVSNKYKEPATLIITERDGVVAWTGSFCFINLNEINWTIDEVQNFLKKINYKYHKIYNYKEGACIFINNEKTLLSEFEEKIINNM